MSIEEQEKGFMSVFGKVEPDAITPNKSQDANNLEINSGEDDIKDQIIVPNQPETDNLVDENDQVLLDADKAIDAYANRSPEEEADDFLSSISKKTDTPDVSNLKDEMKELKSLILNSNGSSAVVEELKKELSELRKELNIKNDPTLTEEEKVSRLQEELPDYAEVIEESIDQRLDKRIEAREAEKQKKLQLKEAEINKKRDAQAKILTDGDFGHSDYFEVIHSNAFIEHMEDPKNKRIFDRVRAAMDKNEFSQETTNLRLEIVRNFKKQQVVSATKQSRTKQLENHKEKIDDLSTQIPKFNNKGNQNKSDKRNFRGEYSEGFHSVFN